jgi:hypothetical protein
MPDPKTDFQIKQTQDDVTTLAAKIKQNNPALTKHQAWIDAMRLLGSA